MNYCGSQCYIDQLPWQCCHGQYIEKDQRQGKSKEYASKTDPKTTQTQMGEKERIPLPGMWHKTSLLLGMSLRFSNMCWVHEGKPLGDELQWHHMDMS